MRINKGSSKNPLGFLELLESFVQGVVMKRMLCSLWVVALFAKSLFVCCFLVSCFTGPQTFSAGDNNTQNPPVVFSSVRFTVNYHASLKIAGRQGAATDSAPIAAESSSPGQAVYNLAPGLYNFKVYRNANNDYIRKFVWVDGLKETGEITIDLPPLPDGYYEGKYVEMTDQLLETHFGTRGLAGFPEGGYDIPTFKAPFAGTRQFMTNEAMWEYINTLDEACGYMRAFELCTTLQNYKVPFVLFTKDPIPAGATIEEAAAAVGSYNGLREIFLFTAGVHGNEQAPVEAHMAFMKDMCGEYGSSLLDLEKVGAVCMIPRINPNGAYTYTRSNMSTNTNMNRDYMSLKNIETRSVVKIFNLFNPTVLVECHEYEHQPINADNTLDNIDDVRVNGANLFNSGLTQTEKIYKGDKGAAITESIFMARDLIEKINENEKGLRAYFFSSYITPAIWQIYAYARNSYSFIIETQGINLGKVMLQRRAFGTVAALKGFIELVLEDGTVAQKVAAAKQKTADKGLVYDPDDVIVLQTNSTRTGEARLEAKRPLVHVSGEIVDWDRMGARNFFDQIGRSRPRATAYVFAADAPFAANVLSLLGMHFIGYERLGNGTTLTLRQYTGTVERAGLAAASDVTFPNGAYIVFTDCFRGNIISTLFEPDITDAGSDYDVHAVSLAQMQYIQPSGGVFPFYRSEESYISVALGFREAPQSQPTP